MILDMIQMADDNMLPPPPQIWVTSHLSQVRIVLRNQVSVQGLDGSCG